MIRYKIVTRNRTSIISPMCFDTKYTRIYMEGRTVIARKGTLGLFCFKTKKDADKFNRCKEYNKIIRVNTLGRGKKPKQIVLFANDEALDTFYLDYKGETCTCETSTHIPIGTICYKAVKVLD